MPLLDDSYIRFFAPGMLRMADLLSVTFVMYTQVFPDTILDEEIDPLVREILDHSSQAKRRVESGEPLGDQMVSVATQASTRGPLEIE